MNLQIGPSVLWLLGSFLLESVSLKLPYGRFSALTVWTIGCLGHLNQAPTEVVLAMALWSFARTISIREWDVLADWLGVLALWAVYTLVAPLNPYFAWVLAAAACWSVQTAVRRVLAQRALEDRFRFWLRLDGLLNPRRAADFCAAGAFLIVPAENWPVRILLLPLLLGLTLDAKNLLEAVETRNRLQEVEENKDLLREALAEKDQARREALASAEERALLEQLSTRLPAVGGPQELVELLGSLLGAQLKLTTIAGFDSATGDYDDLELMGVLSPYSAELQSFRLLRLGEHLLRQILRDRAPLVCTPPFLPNERFGLLLPFGGGLLYLGRENPPWRQNELRWLSWVLARSEPIVQALRWRSLDKQELQQAHSKARDLQARVESQRWLLDCASRFSVHLKAEDLWAETVDWLLSVLQLQAAASPPWFWGEPFKPAALSHGPSYYLAKQDRERWPIDPGPFENVLALPHSQGTLVLAFRGRVPLGSGPLEMLAGVATLFGTALARANLHADVLATQRRLEQSQELWLQSQKSLAMAQLSAGVAHELNSPLGAVRLAIESSLAQVGETHRRRLERAMEACRKAEDIIQRLARMAEEAKEGGSVDLVQVARQVLDQLAPRLKKSGVDATLDAPTHLAVPINQETAENLLVPLLINAIEAVEQAEERRILLRLSQDGFEVLDTGPGVPEHLHARLTEPFFTTKRIGTNVGLGLAVVNQACRQVGATLTFENLEKDGGMRFRVRLAS